MKDRTNMRQSLAEGEPGGSGGQDKHASKSGRGGAGGIWRTGQTCVKVWPRGSRGDLEDRTNMRQSLAEGEPGGCEGQDKHASKSGRGGAGGM